MEKLKNCPCCKSDDVLAFDSIGQISDAGVCCHSCGLKIHRSESRGGKAKAIEAWERRPEADKKIDMVAVTAALPYVCKRCDKRYGKSNLEYAGTPLWVACECFPKDVAFFVAENKIDVIGIIEGVK